MTLVMDGVVRRVAIVPLPVPEPRVKRMVAAVSPAAPGVRYVTGIDGIRRPMAAISPREILQNMQAPAAALPSEVAAPVARRWNRSAIAFGLVATALVLSGAATYRVATSHAAAITTSRAVAPASRTGAPKLPVAAPAVAPTPAATPDSAGLQALVNSFAAGRESKWGIVIKDLKTGETATLNADRSETSASLYKLFVAQQIYGKIDSGSLGYGSAAGGGTGTNISSCLTSMITISDNGCGVALGNIIGWGSQNSSLRANGYTGTSLATPQQTSAKDVATLLERIYKGTLNSPNANAAFLDLLKSQRVNNRLPLGLPAGTVFAHKTGDLDGYLHDAGIVYGPKSDYLVVVMGSPGVTYNQFVTLSQQLWNHFQQ